MTTDDVSSSSPASDSGQQSAVSDHDLPMLRVHRAWTAAEKIAEAHDIDRGVALAIARKVIGIVGEGTRRWGHLCTSCRSLVTWPDDHGPVCPEHGRLGGMATLTLLISFEPLDSDGGSDA